LQYHTRVEVKGASCFVTVDKMAVTLAVRNIFFSGKDIEMHVAGVAQGHLGRRPRIAGRRVTSDYGVEYEMVPE
jgi:hypothetical protein